jgi:diacylglycerol kinase (ATP)
MRAKVIFNPYANRGRVRPVLPAIKHALDSTGIDYDLVTLGCKGQAKQEAISATFGSYDAVVAAGGDSTIHEIVNGLVVASDNSPTIPMGMLPLGIGNYFGDKVGVSRDLYAAAQRVGNCKRKQVDVGSVSYITGDGFRDGLHRWQGSFFHNNSVLAMESMATKEVCKAPRLPGRLQYCAAILRSLFKVQTCQMQLSWDGGAYEGSVSLLSVVNSPRVGGLFMAVPNALLDDGLFDLVFAPQLPIIQTLSILPGFIRGKAVRHPAIKIQRTTKLHAKCQPGTPIHADGEIIAEKAIVVSYQIIPHKLTLLVL